jgi:hypothetical protein
VSPEPGRAGDDDGERELREAFERYERDLPMTAVHVAKLLAISERSVRRMVRAAGQSRPGGTRVVLSGGG